ncbi:MAG: polyprenyl synthetase family protein [Phycisphaerae bacterium]|nr:polyprenyl synthetase family protein [Phycisphaerae bacterium]
MPGILSLAASHAPTSAVLASGLARVESRFREQLDTTIAPVAELCEYVERYRGKMLRPTLVILSGMAASPSSAEPNENQVTVAAVIEMIHMATLVHDDVLDEASVRRGGDTVNKRKGNEAAIILGDYLLSKSFHLCSSLDEQSTALRVGEVTSIVCEGEMLQLAQRGDYSLDEPAYFEIIRRKTAALIALACELGAAHAGAPRSLVQRLSDFGDKIGTAFQIQDDLLDLVGDEPTVGKSLGKDLAKGKLTLPIIHHLACLDPARRASTIDRLRRGADAETDRAALAADLESTGSIRYARHAAESLVSQAKSLLAPLDGSPARSALLAIADAVITRAF